jgi:hypothetical protein
MKEGNRLIVADQSWADVIPEWIKKEISAERMINGMVDIIKPQKDGTGQGLNPQNEVGDAEIVAYLMTASLRGPLNSDFTDIYLYVSANVMLRTKKIKEEADLPDFMQEIYKKGLTDWQKTQLQNLRSDIGRARGKINHPIFDVLRELKGGLKKNGRKVSNTRQSKN